MKGLKINPCVGCRNNCLRIDLLCRVGFDFDLQCWRNKFEEGIKTVTNLLLRVAKVQPFNILVSSEGTQLGNLHQGVIDLGVLERAHLVKGQTKEANHNVYRQYELTVEGAELVEELSKET